MNGDVVSILEAAYQVELTEQAWLENIVRAFQPSLDQGLGITAYTYDATDLSRVRIGWLHSVGGGPLDVSREQVQAVIDGADPEYVRLTWRGLPCATLSQSPRVEQQRGFAALRQLGVQDVLVVNATDPTWRGCWIGACLPDVTRLSAEVQVGWSRVAAHVAAGFRLRARLEQLERVAGADEPEAVLAPSGKLLHAEEVASSRSARDALRHAARTIDRARTRAGRARPERTLAEWQGLIAARWTLLEHFESDGRRFLFARRNDSAANRPPALTPREYQVAAFLSLGHSTKLIAYELGISPSTVRVLLSRAADKLGVGTREDLVRALQQGAFTKPP